MQKSIMSYNWRNHSRLSKILFGAIFLFLIYNTKKTEAKAKDLYKSNSNDLVPGTGQYCEGCYATIDILLQEFTKSNPDIKGPYRMDQKWEDFKENLCDTNNLKKYVYSPPKMTKVCLEMLNSFKNVIIDVIQKHDHMSFEEHVKTICIEQLHACNNYLSIPSIARKNEHNLEKEKFTQDSQKPKTLEKEEDEENRIEQENPNHQIRTKEVQNDEL